MTYREAIQQRVSTRTFVDELLDTGIKTEILSILNDKVVPPFGQAARFHLIEHESRNEKLGTYGFIKNASSFIVGAIPNRQFAPVDYGFQLEKIILELTRIRLGTCWLGGTFTRTTFSRAIQLQHNELLPCITPVGLPAEEKRFADKIIRRAAGSDNRKPWKELFFQDNTKTPLVRENVGDYEAVLDMVRLAPSASNKQPWRVIKNEHGFHFFLNRTRGYRSQFKSVDLQMVDMGIALCHWTWMAAELELAGQWNRYDGDAVSQNTHSFEYITTWQNQ